FRLYGSTSWKTNIASCAISNRPKASIFSTFPCRPVIFSSRGRPKCRRAGGRSFDKFNLVEAADGGSIMIRCRFLMVIVLLVLPGSFARGQSESTQKLIEGAKKEGKLLWYTALNVADADMLLRRFEQKFP